MCICTRVLALGAAVLLCACAGDTRSDTSRGVRVPASTAPSQPQTPAMTAGQGSDFGNATPATQGTAGAGGMARTPAKMPPVNCKGGLYLGSYSCTINVGGAESPLDGDVSFALEIDESVTPGMCNSEFCPDLVIAKGSGTLFGLAGLIGFEAKLAGGLDCQTGEFRASAPAGTWGTPGNSDPNDPNSRLTVLDPPFGTFVGTMTGTHATSPAEQIAGDWDLADDASGTHCAGPFMVKLQP